MVENRDGSYDVARTNLRGDVVSWVTASTGAPETDRFEYDPWGNILSGPRFAPPIRYASYYYDEESGLYYVKARYYSPELGRFLTRDLARRTADYRYCLGNPVGYADSSGHDRQFKSGEEPECQVTVVTVETNLTLEDLATFLTALGACATFVLLLPIDGPAVVIAGVVAAGTCFGRAAVYGLRYYHGMTDPPTDDYAMYSPITNGSVAFWNIVGSLLAGSKGMKGALAP